jgi:hypothetical protein
MEAVCFSETSDLNRSHTTIHPRRWHSAEHVFCWNKEVVILLVKIAHLLNDELHFRRDRKRKLNEFGPASTSFVQGLDFIVMLAIREVLSSRKQKRVAVFGRARH